MEIGKYLMNNVREYFFAGGVFLPAIFLYGGIILLAKMFNTKLTMRSEIAKCV